MKIDAHHHFWHYNTRDYGWISDEMAVLRRDFLPADLKPELDAAGIDRVVSVQARQCVEETEWLLSLAEKNDFIAGVVGWLPIASPEFPALLERFAANPKLRALRHVVQDEPDDRFILGDDFNRGVDRILATGLVYDILIFERHLPYAIEFVRRHSPEQVFGQFSKPFSFTNRPLFKIVIGRRFQKRAFRIGRIHFLTHRKHRNKSFLV